MWKNLAVFGLLLVVVCLVPVLGQTPDHGSESSHNPKQQTASGNTPAKPTITIIEKNCESDQFKNDADCKHTENNEQTVAISKLPTTNVAVQRSDPYDWLAYWTGIVLVVVGIVGIFVGWRTLRWLRVQTIATQDAAKAANDSTAIALSQIQMMKDKERARLIVKVVCPDVIQFGTNEGNRITLQIENIGATLAQNVAGIGEMKVRIRQLDPEGFIDIGPQELVLPSVMRENLPIFETYLVFDLSEKWGDELALIHREPILVEMRGAIDYEDIFGGKHSTQLCYNLRIPWIMKWRNNSIGEVHPMSQWSKCEDSKDS